jgi:hypothetical protein
VITTNLSTNVVTIPPLDFANHGAQCLPLEILIQIQVDTWFSVILHYSVKKVHMFKFHQYLPVRKMSPRAKVEGQVVKN